MYIVPCTSDKRGKQQILSLPTKYGSVVFAFVDSKGALGPFVELCGMLVKGGVEIVIRIDTSKTLDDLTASVASEFSSDQKFVLAVEGTPVFERLINELADRTIWPHSDPEKKG